VRFRNLILAMAQRRARHYEVAKACGLSASNFSKALCGRREFSTEERLKIAQLLGCPQKWLFRKVALPPQRSDPRDTKLVLNEELR
jgi:transcriptional regulator with XRE-family HTH domain